jgi:glycosyltransferase involved in cell wall biosynthesis
MEPPIRVWRVDGCASPLPAEVTTRISPRFYRTWGSATSDDCKIAAVAEPCVSVLLPTHNRPEWLAEALESVLTGDFEDFEVLVSNNGRAEDTRELARVVRDARVRWIEQDESLGMLDNFLAALSQARGKYVALLHDDDRWLPGFLAALVPPLERRSDGVLGFVDHFVVDGDGRIDEAATESFSRQFGRKALAAGFHQPFFELAARQTVAITGAVFRRASLPISAFTPEVGSFYDIWTTYQLARTGGAAYYHDERLLYYRVHNTSVTASNALAAHLGNISCRKSMLADPSMRPYRAVLRKRLAQDHVSAGAVLLRQGERVRAREHLEIAARLAPNWKSAGGLAASWLAPRRVLARL